MTLARTPDGAAEAKKVLANVRKHFSGHPEGDESKIGIKAVKRLEQLRKLEASGKLPEGAREKAAGDYKQPRWKALFTGGDLPEVEKPKPAEPSEEDDEEDGEDSEIDVG